jgi:flagellar protein FlgJ
MENRFAPLIQRQLAIGKQEGLAPVKDAAAQPADNVINPETGAPADPLYRAKATEAAVKFESFFISHMLHEMRASGRALQADDDGHRDKTNDDMLDMADNMVADQMAGRRAFGVADAILRQLLPPAGPAAAPAGAALPLHPAAPAIPLSPQQLPVTPNTKSSSSI